MIWINCCKLAIERLKNVDICELDESDTENKDVQNHNKVTNLWIIDRTLMHWFHDFRKNNEFFINVPKR